MKPEQTIIVRLVDKSGAPLHISGVYIDLDLYTHGNYRYGFRLNPTNQHGELKIDYEMVELKRTEAAKMSVMDYNTTLIDCDDRIKIYAPSGEVLKKAYEWIVLWFGGKAPTYAEGWLTANNAKVMSTEVFAELKDKETIVLVPCELFDNEC